MSDTVRRTIRLDSSRKEDLEAVAECLGGYGKTLSQENLLRHGRGILVDLFNRYRSERSTDQACSLSDFRLWIESRLDESIPAPHPGQPHSS